MNGNTKINNVMKKVWFTLSLFMFGFATFAQSPKRDTDVIETEPIQATQSANLQK